MKMDLLKIFRAGRVNRWHTNPDLAHTNDRIDGHGARVARIILALHPDPSLDLIRAALIHDDGESVVGDVKAPFKDDRPDIADALADAEGEAVEAIWGRGYVVERIDGAAWLKFADRLDAYMWAAHHAPHVLSGDGWPEAKAALIRMAADLLSENPVGASIVCATIDRMGVRHAVA